MKSLILISFILFSLNVFCINEAPVPWPNETTGNGGWQIMYSELGIPIKDDTGNPDCSRNASVSGNNDLSRGDGPDYFPSGYFAYDPQNEVLFFRFRIDGNPLRSEAKNTGDGAGSNPYVNVTYNLMIDIDGDGFKEFNIVLDGPSGGAQNSDILPSGDDLKVYYSNSGSQCVTAEQVSNYQISASNDMVWYGNAATKNAQVPQDPNADGATWDFGRTRVVYHTSSNNEFGRGYFVDIQVPFSAFTDSYNNGNGGTQIITQYSPLSFGFSTSTNQQNPLLKDYASNKCFSPTCESRFPYADYMSFEEGYKISPFIGFLTISNISCPDYVELSADVYDTLTVDSNGNTIDTINNVLFKYYFDANNNGKEDDGSNWNNMVVYQSPPNKENPDQWGELDAYGNGSFNNWGIVWNTSGLSSGNYLIKVIATDDQNNTSSKIVASYYLSPSDCHEGINPSWESYSDSERKNVSNTFGLSINGVYVYMYGTFKKNTDYVIAYYNSNDSLIFQENQTSTPDGFLYGTLFVETNYPYGTYHSVVYPQGFTPPNIYNGNYNSSTNPIIADDTFQIVEQDTDGDGISDVVEGTQDTDGDGIPNYQDPDSDGDGVPDQTEGAGDADGDGIANYLDSDSDGDGISDATEGSDDIDNDGIPDFLDIDSDGDGIQDSVEGTGDRDGDGIPNYLDSDSDRDGIPDSVEGTNDTDGDGIPDYLDFDSDNDGILDRVEGTSDADGDGVPNFEDPDLPPDSDGDGVPDATEGTGDSDGDGVPDSQDWDSDNDGISDSFEGSTDLDGDGIPNYLDLDSDGDGAFDLNEGNDSNFDGINDNTNVTDSNNDGRIDTITDENGNGLDDSYEENQASLQDRDQDGIPDTFDPDDDGDGIPTNVEDANGDGNPKNDDADGDGIPNYLDNDSDGDGKSDSFEGNYDSDSDGIPDYLDPDPATDSDGDGIPDARENSFILDDFDGDGIPNYQDSDSDGDGIPDSVEGAGDADGDGIPNFLDLDSDGDGIQDSVEGTNDTDGDGKPNYLDVDSDGDGISDGEEGTSDFDGDGVPNYLDSDSDGDGIPDSEEGIYDGNGDGNPDFIDPGSYPPPHLLRNDETTSLSSYDPSKIFVRAYPLDPALDQYGANKIAQEGEGARRSLNGSDDDDDFYKSYVPNNWIDPDDTVLEDNSRPLVFYELTCSNCTIYLTKENGKIKISYN